MHKTFVSTLLFPALLLVGCGKEEPEQGDLNDAAVQQSATMAYQATQQAISTGDGQAAAFQMLSIGTSALGFVTYTQSRNALELDTTPRADEGCSCTETSCTFTSCGNGSGFVINGTISWTANSLDCDYTVSGDQQGSSYSFSVGCDLDYTETSINGSINTSGDMMVSANGQNTSSEWDSSLVYNNVQFASGQPTSGSIDVDTSITVDGKTYAASGSVTFGG